MEWTGQSPRWEPHHYALPCVRWLHLLAIAFVPSRAIEPEAEIAEGARAGGQGYPGSRSYLLKKGVAEQILSPKALGLAASHCPLVTLLHLQ